MFDTRAAGEPTKLERHLHSTVDAIPALLWSSRPDGAVDFLNRAWLSFTGLELEQALGDGWTQAVHPDDLEHTRQMWAQATRTVTSLEIELRLRRFDGEYRWFLCRAGPVLDAAGRATQWYGVNLDITGRQQADRALRDSEKKFRALFESMQDGFSLLEMVQDERGQAVDFRFLEVNQAFERLTGMAAGQVVGRTLREVMAPESLQQTAVFSQAVVTGEPLDFTYYSPSYQRHLHVRAFSPEKGRFAVIFADVSPRIQAEQALRDSEEKHRVLFTSELIAICIYDLHSLEFLDVNGAFVRLYGYSHQELTSGMTSWDINPDYNAYRYKPQDALQDGSTFIPLAYHRKRDGTRFPVEIYVAVSEWKGRRVAYAMIHDITPRLQAEQALRESEATLNSFFNSAQTRMGIFRSLPEENDQEYLRLNPAAMQYLGNPSGAIPGLRASSCGRSAADRRMWLEQCRLCQESGRPLQFEYPRELPDGQHWMLATLNLSEPGVFSFIVADITGLKRLQHELQQLNAELEERVTQRTAELNQSNQDLKRALRLRDEFLNNISHELRTPLVGILGLSESLQMRVYGELTARQERALINIYTSGRRMQALVDNLLEMSHLAAGKVTLQLGPVDVDRVIQGCLAQVRPEAERKHLELQFRRDPQLSVVQADGQRLAQILSSLLDNAVKFTPQGGRVGLEVDADPEARQVRWVVWDTGIGIPPEQLGELFNLFVQLEGGLARQFGGTGLGLAMVSHLVKLHGGSIAVESAPGQGCRFTVTLPA